MPSPNPQRRCTSCTAACAASVSCADVPFAAVPLVAAPCGPPSPSQPAAVARSARASKRVRRVRVGVNLAYHWGHKFYHALTETLPAFYVMAAILRHNPDAAILLAPRQVRSLLDTASHQVNRQYSTARHSPGCRVSDAWALGILLSSVLFSLLCPWSAVEAVHFCAGTHPGCAVQVPQEGGDPALGDSARRKDVPGTPVSLLCAAFPMEAIKL